MTIQMEVVGVPEMQAHLARMSSSAAGGPLMAAVQAGALLVQNAAKQKVPKRTRTLSRSITTAITREGDTVAARIGPSAPYGKYLEYGTGRYAEGGNGRRTPWVYRGPGGRYYTTEGMKPRPYMRPALDENRERAIKEMQRAFRALMGGAL
jgi:HK97 gp10 family phage protein